MTRNGGCRCGAVRYYVDGEPEHATLCWCEACRRSSGAPVVLWTLFADRQVKSTGTTMTYESSPGTFRDFCPVCGTGLFYRNAQIFAGKVDIQGATFDEADAVAPQAHIQTADAPGWRGGMADLPAFARYPGTD